MPAPVTASIIFVLGGLLTWAIAVVLVCFALIKPPRLVGGRALARLGRLTPADLNLPYADLTFRIRDSGDSGTIDISAWWIPADGKSPTNKTVIILHGFADSKIGSIAWAPLWRELGFNVLAIDLRAHGESGGNFSTAGVFEREDVSQVIDQLRRDRPNETQQLVLFGLSLGGAVAAATAVQRDDIDAVILDSPFQDYRQAVVIHARRRRMPGPFVVLPALHVAEFLLGGSTNRVSPSRTIPEIKAPVLIITGDADPFCTLDDLESLGTPHHIFPDSGHLYSYVNQPETYRALIANFLQERIAHSI